ncbi:hypothetical protein ACH5RR_007226 [Cinchona calisaya]|uniref:Uncharacterized protein n=1 Tax=Cinchona calisaya TaxID=153742 RepID=A0ABD3ARB4_9GENT
MGTRKLIKEELWRRIGNGRNTKIWEDKWITLAEDGKIYTVRPPECRLDNVSELKENFRWKKDRLNEIFCPEDVDRILQIPISLGGRGDRSF